MQIEFEWLLKQLNLTNKALVPVLNATRLKEIRTGVMEDANEEDAGGEKQREGSSAEASVAVDSEEETKLESHVVMKVSPLDSSKQDIVISKKMPDKNDPHSIIDVLDSFFDVQASANDSQALQEIVETNKAQLLNKVVEINQGKLDMIIDQMGMVPEGGEELEDREQSEETE